MSFVPNDNAQLIASAEIGLQYVPRKTMFCTSLEKLLELILETFERQP
jgi:hypothetical protein